jgi:hypothetical protein
LRTCWQRVWCRTDKLDRFEPGVTTLQRQLCHKLRCSLVALLAYVQAAPQLGRIRCRR